MANTTANELSISIIARSNENIKNLENVFTNNINLDNFVYFTRMGGELRLNRIDLDKTDVLIIDSNQISQDDLNELSLMSQRKDHLACVYLATSWSEQNLIDLMRAGVQDVVRSPLNGSSQDLLDAIERIRKKSVMAKHSKDKGKIISFMPCKGGAGATFVAVNLAYQLADKYGQRILFIDLNSQYGDAAYYLTDSVAAGNLADVVTQPYLNSVTIASAAIQVADNFYLLPAANSIEKSAKVQSHQIDTLLTVAGSEYDFIILDLGSSLDSVSTRSIDRSDSVYLVAQPTLNYLKALIYVLNLFAELGYSSIRTGIIMNQSDMDAALPSNKITELLNQEIKIQIPYDGSSVDESINSGIPLVKMSSSHPVSIAIDGLANVLLGRESSVKPETFINKILPFKIG